jgi:diguanylate cyclase (GGDEF)-like protein/PAS domain S-box-containing protein
MRPRLHRRLCLTPTIPTRPAARWIAGPAGWLLAALATLLALALTPPAAAADPKPPLAPRPSVLLLLSYHPTFPTSAKIVEGVREGLGGRAVDLHVEYMHTRFETAPAYLARFADWLEYQMRRRPPDVVIAADDTAFQFALSHHALLHRAPLVFLGVNDVDAARAADALPHVTGVVERVSIAGTLSMIRRVLPKADTLHVISDASPAGRADMETLVREREAFPELMLDPLRLQNLTWQALAERLRSLPPGAPILLLAAYEDASGEDKHFDASTEFLLEHANGPIFHLWEHGIAEGLVGGWVMSHRIHGALAADMALKILDGAAPGNIPVIYDSANRPMVNAETLSRWRLKRNDFPPETEWINPPQSILGDYPRLVTGAVLVFLVLITLLLALVRASRQRARLLDQTVAQRALLTSLLNASPDMIFFKDTEGRFRMINTACARLLGKPEEEIIGSCDMDHFPAEMAREFRQDDRAVLEHRSAMRKTELVPARDGAHEIYETVKAPVQREDGVLLGLIGIARRVTSEHLVSDRLQLAAQVFDNAAEGILITAADGRIEMVNPAFTRITGYTADEVQGKDPSLMKSGRHEHEFYERLWREVNTTGLWQGEIWNRRKSGEIYPEWLNISPVRDEAGNIIHYLGIFSDISAVKHSEAQLEHMAHHDALTGLPNRSLLNDRIDTALRRAQRADRMVAVIFLDLDRFKDINDSFGHAVGDQVLKQVAARLRETIRDEDTVARLGGDEFVILMEDIEAAALAEQAAERLLTCLNPPIGVDHQEFFIGASLGISLFPRDGFTADALIRNADTAMYQAKRQGRNAIQRYYEQQTESARHRMQMETALRRAVEGERFEVWFQPQVELGSGALTGFEALCRWPDPDRGMIPPGEFIPVAESTGLIVPIGELVLRATARVVVGWRRQGLNPPPVAVNVSGRQLRRLDFLTSICSILEEEGCRPEWLELEVTESDILKDAEPAIATLHGIREMGMSLALDDFGTGFSSLSYLKRLPIETLKIDQSFIAGLPADGNDRAIVQAVLAMGRSLEMRVLAEGVESAAQVSALRMMGCGFAQGYRFGRPALPDTFAPEVQRGRISLSQ